MNQAQGQIQAQLQRRADLIPNLVNTVKGVTKQEDTVFISIANARARLGGAIQSGNIPEMAAANAALNQGLGRLIAISENYPQLRSSENFKQLQDQLEGTENRISVARQDYNAAVGEYNAYIRRFPYNITAKVFGLGKPREYFEAAAGGGGGAEGAVLGGQAGGRSGEGRKIRWSRDRAPMRHCSGALFLCCPPARLPACPAQSVTTRSGSTYLSGSTGRPFTCTS